MHFGTHIFQCAVVQSGGHAYRLLGQTLRDEFHRNATIRLLLLRYTQALIVINHSRGHIAVLDRPASSTA